MHEVSKRLDANDRPHVIQRYNLPLPQDSADSRHDQAVYSMWMHFVSFCSQDASGSNTSTSTDTDADMHAYYHPDYMRSRHHMYMHMHMSSTPSIAYTESPGSTGVTCRKHRSRSVQYQRDEVDVLGDVEHAVNPFTNVSRLGVLRSLSLSRGMNVDLAVETHHQYPAHTMMLEGDSNDLSFSSVGVITSGCVTPRNPNLNSNMNMNPNMNMNMNMAVHTRCSPSPFPSPSPSYLSCVSLAQKKDEDDYAAVELNKYKANSGLLGSSLSLHVGNVSSDESSGRSHAAVTSTSTSSSMEMVM